MDGVVGMSSEVSGNTAVSKAESMVTRLVKGVGVGLIGQVLGVASRLILPPLFLKCWGIEVYGDWLLISAIVANLALSEVGGGLYVVNRMTQSFAAKDVAGVRATAQTALLVFTVWPALVFLVFAGALWCFPGQIHMGLKHVDADVARAVAVVLAFQVFVSIPQGLVLGIFRAVGDYPRGAMLSNYLQLAQVALVGLGLWGGLGIQAIAFLQMLPVPVVALLALRELHGRFPAFQLFAWSSVSREVARQMIKPSAHFFLIHISLALSVQGTVIVAGYVLGATQVVVFSTMRTLSNVIKAILGMVSHAAWPDLTRLDAQGDRQQLGVLFTVILKTNVAATIGVGAILLNFGGGIYQLWLGKVGLYDPSLMTRFMVLLALQVIWSVYGHLLMATNRHQGMSLVTVSASVMSIVAAYAGARTAGMAGMLNAMILAELLPLWAVPYLVHRHDAQFSVATFMRACAGPMLLLVPLALWHWTAWVLLPALTWWWWRAARAFLRATRKAEAA